MSRREYDDYDRHKPSGGVEYSSRQRSPPRGASGSSYGPPGGFPESPKDSYPRTTYPAAPIPMPQAPLPPPDDVYHDSISQRSATIVSGRRPPSPGVRFADEPRRAQPANEPRREQPRGDPARVSAGQQDWKRVYERELAEQRQLDKELANAPRGQDPERRGTTRGLDVNVDTDRLKGKLSLGRRKDKEKRDNDLAWSSDDTEDEKERERERENRRRRERERERERERQKEMERIEREKAARRKSGNYDDPYGGDPRRSAGQLYSDPRKSGGALPLAITGDPRRHYDDPRRSSGHITYEDPRRSSGHLEYDDPRRSGGHLVRYEEHRRREPSPPGGDLSGVRYVQRPHSPSSGRPPSSSYTLSEPTGRQRASSVGRRHPSVGPINTDVARMSIHERDREYDRDRYHEYNTPSDAYRPSYYDLSPMPSPSMGPRDRGFNFDVGGNFSLGNSLASANMGYAVQASSGKQHKHSRSKGEYIRPEEKKRPQEPDYDPKDHAQILYKALKGKVADVGAIVKIVPFLTGEQILMLRTEYKKVHPLGNVNLAKHLKAQLSGKVQLAAYATALGPFESETYWATLSNQKPNFRHALLIEALMGAENDDILDIKDSYRDSKNNNDFEKAITKELSDDKGTGEKFKELVLIQLDARGMNEWDKVYLDEVRNDAEDLHDALEKDKVDSLFVGKIVITRSSTHLREMMRLYKKLFDQDLARLIAQKITGLVGEALLHILNGVLNKPARDARLLEESMKGVGTRDDLLVARLVRIHWDPDHLTAVKDAYKSKYGMSLKERIRGECSGTYQEFLLNLISVDTHTTALVKA